jgi:hypothetical protein
MLNFGLWASKGMVKVPNLSGLTPTTATTSIEAANLIASNGGSTDTSNSGLNNTIASQLPNADDLVDYGTTVSFIYYNYVAPPPTPTPDPPQNSSISGISISGTTCTITGSFPQNATNISVNNVNIGSWSYTSTSLSFDVSSYAAGTLSVQVYNGRTPLLPAQSVSWGGSTPTPTPTGVEWITMPYISSKTDTSLTYTWQASGAQSWELRTGGTTVLDSGNGGANGAVVNATRTGLNPSSSYTSTIRVYPQLNQGGTYISDPVSGTTNASTPSGGGGGTPSNPTCTAADGTKTYTYGEWSAWSACSGGTQTSTRTVSWSFTRTYADCTTETISGTDNDESRSQNCTNPSTGGATYTTSGPNFGSSPSCPPGSTKVSGDTVYVQGSTSTSVTNGSCGSVSVYGYAGSGVYYVSCCQS